MSKRTAVGLAASLNKRRSQVVYASTLKLVDSARTTTEAWLQIRREIVRQIPDFTLSQEREGQEYVLARSGRVQAEGEYILKIAPRILVIGAGKDVDFAEFQRLYSEVWPVIHDVLTIPRTAILEFDIQISWIVTTRGNPYEQCIGPAILRESTYKALSETFLYQFDPDIRFQIVTPGGAPDMTRDPIYVLQVKSVRDFYGVASASRKNEQNEVHVVLGCGLSNQFFGVQQGVVKDIIAAHWTKVVAALGSYIVPNVMEPLIASMEEGATASQNRRGKSDRSGDRRRRSS
jgi:hypothetical protein